MKKVVWYLVKFFKEEQHADQFIAGQLYLNRLSYYKKVDDEVDDGRRDETEAVAMWWQPDDIVIKLNVPGIGETEITKKDLAGPVSVSFNNSSYLHVFCMYAIHTSGFECIDGKIDYTEEDADILKNQLEIDDRCFKFGRFAVVTPAVPFLDHVKQSLQSKKYGFIGKLVKYYDDESFHGEIDVKELPFWKQKRFSYQHEFRICISPKTMDDEAITIDIGDIKHICAKTESANLNSLFKIDSIKLPIDQNGSSSS